MMKKNYVIIIGAILIIVLAIVLVVLYRQSREPAATSVVPLTNTGEVVECYTDADCIVGGCSGTVCAARSTAGDTVTTCEYRSEYACFAKDNCLCIQNRCNWQGNQQFRNCIVSPGVDDPCALYEGDQHESCVAQQQTDNRCVGFAGMDLLNCLTGTAVNVDE